MYLPLFIYKPKIRQSLICTAVCNGFFCSKLLAHLLERGFFKARDLRL